MVFFSFKFQRFFNFLQLVIVVSIVGILFFFVKSIIGILNVSEIFTLYFVVVNSIIGILSVSKSFTPDEKIDVEHYI